jgi:hypothetical protein
MKELHCFENQHLVVALPIVLDLLRIKRVSDLNVSEFFNPGGSVALRKHPLNFVLIGAMKSSELLCLVGWIKGTGNAR